MHEVIGRASSPDDATTCGQAWGEEEEEEEEEEENTAQPGPRSSTTTQVGDEPSTSIHPLVEVYKYQVAGPPGGPNDILVHQSMEGRCSPCHVPGKYRAFFKCIWRIGSQAISSSLFLSFWFEGMYYLRNVFISLKKKLWTTFLNPSIWNLGSEIV